jgi:hypothetical protein
VAKPISPKLHGVIDYLAVPLLLAAGPLFGFKGVPAETTSTLAGIVLVLAVFTAYPLGLVKMIPIKMHLVIDAVLGIGMIVSLFVLHFSSDARACYFFVGFGIVVLLLVLLTAPTSDVQHA